MMSLASLFIKLQVTILTLVVVGSFTFSSLAWTHIEASQVSKIIVAGLILLSMYLLMIFELVNRTLAALIGAAVSIAAHDCLIEWVSMSDILAWQDLETLALLFGMMIIVNVLSCSGLFDFLAIWAYKKSAGRFWTLLIIMSFITAFLSAFIDNVSTMLLMSPTLIKLSELEHIDPRLMLMMMVVFCNIGGCATPVGDPPNLIIIGDSLVSTIGITFGSFTAYCAPGVLLTMASVLVYMKLSFKSKERFRVEGHESKTITCDVGNLEAAEWALKSNPQIRTGDRQSNVVLIEQMSKELDCVQNFYNDIKDARRVSSMCSSQLEDELDKHRKMLKNNLIRLQGNQLIESNTDQYLRRGSRLTADQINQLMRLYSIRSKSTLVLSLAVLVIAVLLFFVQSIPGSNLTLGWVSLFAGLTLLVVTSPIKLIVNKKTGPADQPEMALERKVDQEQEEEEDNFEWIIGNIEWSTLIFFFALFIVMEVMQKLGLISFLGNQITCLVDYIPAGHMRSIGAITIILWASALASALIDNVPFTSMMIKVLGTMIEQQYRSATVSDQAVLTVKPLIFALAFGSCFGGNGTIIGASANLVTTGVARRHGYPISFTGFMKFTGPVTIISLIIANMYLIFVFVILGL